VPLCCRFVAVLAAVLWLACAPAAGEAGAWLRVDPGPEDARAPLPEGAIVYPGFVWLPEAAAAGVAPGRVQARVADPFAMRVGEYVVDPASGLPEAGEWYRPSAESGPDFRLVQFRGPIKRGWLDDLLAAGVRPVQYLHPFAYVVWADAGALTRAGGHAAVRFAGAFVPAMRAPSAPDPGARGGARAMALVYGPEAERIRAAIEAAGAGVVLLRRMGARFAVIELVAELVADRDRHLELARIPGVFTIQSIPADGGPRGEMAAQSVAGGFTADPDGPGGLPGHEVFPGYPDWLDGVGLDGTGVVVGIVDGGLRETHEDLDERIRPCTGNGGSCGSTNDNHGTHVAGAVAGAPFALFGVTDDAGFLRGQGVAPGAGLVEQLYPPFLAGGPGSIGGMVPDAMLDIFRDSVDSGAAVVNNSWGPSSTPQGYDIPTMQVDMIVRDADPDQAGAQPLVAVWAIMNGGGDGIGECAPSSLGSPDEAKNLIAVGSTALRAATGEQRAEILNLSANSAHGPACDGRRVPHLVAPGCFTDSTLGGGDSDYGLFCGTSMAAPVVAGAAALYIEQFRARHAASPGPALVKAVFAAAARSLAGYRDADGGLLDHRPDRRQGWGRLDLAEAIEPPQALAVFDRDVVFTDTGQAWRWPLLPADPDAPVRIVLAWTDAPGPGSGGATPAWVNDLDLGAEVGGVVYRGNDLDAATGFSNPDGAPDARNNLEGVMLAPAQHQGALVEIEVLAANLAADALDPWTPAPGVTRQDFALACFNCVPERLFGDGFEAP